MHKTNEFDAIPDLYDTVGNVIRFGFTERTKQDEDGVDYVVYAGYCVPLTGYIDYGHIKSQIIEHVYAPKEEFAVLNNAVSALLKERAGIVDPTIEEDITAFLDFEEWRNIAADAARQLVDMKK